MPLYLYRSTASIKSTYLNSLVLNRARNLDDKPIYIYKKSFESGYQCYTLLFKSVHITLEKRDSNVQLRMQVKRTKLAYPVKMHSIHKYTTSIHIICNLKYGCTQPFVLKYWQKLHQRRIAKIFETSNWRPPFVPIYQCNREFTAVGTASTQPDTFYEYRLVPAH